MHKNTGRAALVSPRWPAPRPSRERQGGVWPADSDQRPIKLDHYHAHPPRGPGHQLHTQIFHQFPSTYLRPGKIRWVEKREAEGREENQTLKRKISESS